MLFLLASGAVPFKIHRKTCKVTKKNWNMKEKQKKMHFFSKIFGHIKKKQYLCTRFREGSMRDVVQPG